ncbi:MAG: dienelactone hydrolase family protein [Betaproteobacteria bacterium]|nr:dienelactone hydrolase family protein [Betaproteobacteria bacterium]
MRRFVTTMLALLAAGAAPAQSLEKFPLRHGATEVPVEVAKPRGRAPFAPVLYIHAKRGFEDVDREHMRALAADGFLVLAPDWLAGNMLERWPDRHYPETEADVEAALDALVARTDVCKGPVGIVAKSRGPYFAIRLAAKRAKDIAAIVSYYGHFQNPNAPEPQQLFSIAPEVRMISSPVLMLIGDADYELRRFVNGRAFYALWERGVSVEMQMYPMARRAFDFRPDATPEEKIARRHAALREREWLRRWMKLTPEGRCG